MNKGEIINKISNLCREYSDILGRVILFGSYSRDEATGKSDVDLFIEPYDLSVTTGKFGSSKRYKQFKYDLHDSIPLEFDLLAYGGKRDIEKVRKSPLWKQIEKDGVVIYDKRAKSL